MAFDLRMDRALGEKVRDWAQGAGLRMFDAGGGIWVLVAPELPKKLVPFLADPGQAGGDCGKKGEDGTAKRPAPAARKAAGKGKPAGAEAPAALRVLNLPFEERSLARAAGASWNAEAKAWTLECPGGKLPEAARRWACEPFSWGWYAERSLAGDFPSKIPAKGAYALRGHQKEAVELIAKAKAAGSQGFLLADEVGLGKTMSAWRAVCKILEGKPGSRILVVCPLSVAAAWREEILRSGAPTGKILVINYDALSKLFSVKPGSGGRRSSRVKTAARSGSAPEFDAVVFDESHKLKNRQSSRSKLAQKLAENAGFVLWLSATAGQSPLELGYLSALLGREAMAAGKKANAFEDWCLKMGFKVKKGGFGNWVWERNEEDCAKIRTMLFDRKVPLGLRRLPSDIAGWPEISRQVQMVELTAEQRALYEETWARFKKSWAPPGRGNPKAQGTAQAQASRAKQDASGLVELLRFRQKCSLIRLGNTADFVEDLLENGKKAAVSVAFLETADELAKALEARKIACCKITGAMDAKERERRRLEFQKGPAQVCIFTIEEGISLHQGEHDDVPRSMVIHDLRWSAIAMAQIEGRAHRNGKFAQAYWMAAADTVEEKMARAVAERAAALKSLVGDDVESLEKELYEILGKREAP